MKGRRLGTVELTLEEMQTITHMTEKDATRREIAVAVSRSTNTVWRYQKKFDLI